MSDRQYELVLLGVTGYTGKLTAEYITNNVATDLKWAIAGRNSKKIEDVAAELKSMNADRPQPAIEIVEQKYEDLLVLAKKTKVLITTVGPYAQFGEPVVKACVEAGTHVLDVTGETPFTFDMMQKYHDAAKSKGVCIVPHCGIDSVPSDILTYLCAKAARENLNVGLRDVVNSLQKASGAVSGGTSHTAISLVEAYPLSFLAKSMRPTALVPQAVSAPTSKPPTMSLASKILGYRYVKDLGTLTDSLQSSSDVGIVYRSWALFADTPAAYGEKFSFAEYMKVSSPIIASLVHYVLSISLFALYFRPFRWLLKRYAYAPGTGQTREEASKNLMIYKAVGTADEAGVQKPRRAVAKYKYVGSNYYMTGLLLTEAALVLSRGGDVLGKRLGGMITPATLEMEYVERLQKAGVELEWGVLEP